MKIKFNKILPISIFIGSTLSSPISICANEKNIINSRDTGINTIKDNRDISSIYKEKNFVNDIEIKWLYDNTTLYIGADMIIEAVANQDAANTDIKWTKLDLDGKFNVINLQQMGNIAMIKAIKSGKSEVMAKAMGGSEATRQIVVNVDSYPNDELSKKLISNNITPIQSFTNSDGEKILQVESNRSLQYSDKVEAIDTYLKKLALIGELSSEEIDIEHEYYDFYTISIESISDIQVDIRVDKLDKSYTDIKDKLLNLEQYNTVEPDPPVDPDIPVEPDPPIEPENPEDPDIPVNPDIPLDPDLPVIPEDPNIQPDIGPPVEPDIPLNPDDLDDNFINEVTQGIDEIIILGGKGTEHSPIKLEIRKDLSSEEKIHIMRKYLDLIQYSKDLEVIDVRETKEYSAYKIKVTNKTIKKLLKEYLKNDFYIEIIVDKGDKKSYEPIIQMLDKLYKNDKNQPQIDSNIEENNENKENNDTNTQQHISTDNKSTNIDEIDKKQIKNDDLSNMEIEQTKHSVEVSKDKSIIKQDSYKLEDLNSSAVVLTTVTGASIGGIALKIYNNRSNKKLRSLFRKEK